MNRLQLLVRKTSKIMWSTLKIVNNVIIDNVTFFCLLTSLLFVLVANYRVSSDSVQ